MRLFIPAFVAALLSSFPVFAAPGVTSTAAAVSNEDYRLSVGDVIRVEVHDEPDLTLEVQLPSTGTVDYPFLGKMQVSGLTIAQFKDRVTKGLRGDYLINPEVSVRIVQYRPFFVRGQVRNSGGYPYVLGLTVEKAVTIAGGFTDRASMRNIFLIRENTTQEQKVKAGLDSVVAPGDTIIVEESLF